ncbi:MAG: RluA family pseudouridine synthase [Oscillospiraceae bacterium]|jgi:23S rRNA pseudouridine1911/1915/1917 synthase|nr:RluA family pseudouridine synthase [Oscillospiraceae bacterium]
MTDNDAAAQTLTPASSFSVGEQDADTRLDSLLARHFPELTRSQAQGLIERGAVLLSGLPCKKNERPKAGAEISVTLPELEPYEALAQQIALDIRYEDGDLLVVNKPQGMVVHPAAGNRDGTLVNALLAHCGDSLSGINGVLRPGIVHRIDKDTAGLLLVAKNDFAHRSLAAQLAAHSIQREYRAVCVGTFREELGTVDAPIGRSRTDRKKFAVTGQRLAEDAHNVAGTKNRLSNRTPADGKCAVTHYRVLQSFSPAGLSAYSYLALRLETGRTHQIRVHMAHLGHPVAGDPLYRTGKMPRAEFAIGGQCLFAALLGFRHPRTGEEITLEAELPPWFREFLERIG